MDGGAEALGILLGDDHGHVELARRLDQDAGRTGHRVRLGDGGHEALLHVDDDEGRTVPLQQGGAELPCHGAQSCRVVQTRHGGPSRPLPQACDRRGHWHARAAR